ncbi:MAG TPA: hypothetical protein GXZ48_02745 [Acholeplasmataceae bacterium]|jgi:hypothetical protein|nr:hypothetical protein [Acholeplasmataceae bacterium]
MKKLVKGLLVLAVIGLMFVAPLGNGRESRPKYPDDRPISYINSIPTQLL